MEISKTLRAHGPNGHSYEKAVSGTTDCLSVAEEAHESPQHPFENEEGVAPAVIAGAEQHRTASILGAWIAEDPVTVRLIQEAPSIAKTSSTVLIRGESGTGKDLMAWILHALSSRADRPLIRVDCSSLPSDLTESELFGNDLVTSNTGRLEAAAEGTLVLDEVSALSLPAQAKLLRAIEERRFESSGNSGNLCADTRVIALTTSNLEHAVSRRAFREDLYYRLNVIPMVIPPLREREADILPLANYFLQRSADMNRRSRMEFGSTVLAAFEGYSWPGNVRELRSVVERAVLNATSNELGLMDLPQPVRDSAASAIRTKMSLEDVERNYISEILEHTRGKKTLAAKILGISRKTLLEKRKRYGLD